MPPWSELVRRLGGKRAITVTAFLLGSPFWALGLLFNENSTFESARNAWVLLGITVIGQVAMGLTLWLAHLTVAKNRAEKPVAVWLLIVIWSASALTRLAVVVYGMELFDLRNDVPLITRILTSIFMAVVGFGIAAYALDAFDRFREERARLLQKILAEEGMLSTHRDTIEGMKTALLAQIDERMKDSSAASADALDRLEQALASREDVQPALTELRELSDQTWQRISQDLWSQAPQRPPRISVVELFSLFAKSRPFSIAILAILSLFLYLLVYSRVVDPFSGAIITLTWLGFSVGFTLVANTVLSRLDRLAIPGLFIAIGALVFSSIPLVAVFSSLGFDIQAVERIVIVHGLSVLMGVFMFLPPAVIRTRQMVLNNLRDHISQKTMEKLRVESELAVVTQKIANHLHGDIRGNFLASMLTLQGHLDRNESTEVRKTIHKIRELLAEPMTISDDAQHLSEELDTFLRNWSALIDISMNKPLSDFPEIFQPALHTIVVDAVNNAVRHGAADWIRISLTSEPDAVVINIQNNGNPNTATREGLGTANLNQLAPDMWSRIPVGQGITQLLVRLDRAHLESSLARG